MTALSALQSATVRLVGSKPSAFFSATDKFEMEMVELLNDVARDIAKSHDWQALITTHTLIGDGTTTTFSLPADYDRMLYASKMFDPNTWAWGYHQIANANDWIRDTATGFSLTPGGWIILGGYFQFVPAPANGAEAKFPYVSSHIAVANGATKEAFTNDDDSFRLDERLLTLGLIWRWREMKGFDASADQANFEKAFNEASGRDRGPGIIIEGTARMPANVGAAYPWPLGA